MHSTHLSTSNFTKKDIADLHEALAKCMIAQRTYGKQAGDLPAIMQVFIEAMPEHSPEKINNAIHQWLLKSGDFPTPYDIICVIEEKTNGRDKPNSFVYSNLCRKNDRGEQLSPDEFDYINKYQRYYIDN